MGRLACVGHLVAPLAIAVAAGCTAPASVQWEPRTPELAGSVWRWTETLTSDATRIRPAAPERYTLEFLADGVTRARADCNIASGRYASGPDQKLELGRMAVTQAACLPGSLGDAYLQGLANVAAYRFDGEQLVLVLRHDGGTMRFAPLKR